MNSFAWSLSLLYFRWMWTIFLFSFFLFFLTCLVGMWHTFFGYASFISFFCIAHILYGHFREKESWYVMEFNFVGGWQYFPIFQCRRIAYVWTCTWSWSWENDTSLPRVKEFDKTQSKVKLHMKVWAWKSNFGFGRNFHYFEETSYWWVF